MLRFRIPDIFLGAILGVATLGVAIFAMGFVLGSSQYSGQSTQSQGPEKTDGPESKNEQQEPWWQRAVTDPIAVFTLCLVLVGAFQVGLFYVQLKIIRKSLVDAKIAANAAKSSADSAVIIERLYIFVTTPRIVAGPKGRRQELDYALTNYGRTPAILRFYTSRTYTKDHPQRPIDTTMWNGWEVLRTGESHQGKLFEIRQKLEVDKNPLFWIEVFYLDMFNDMHTSGFTFFYMEDISGKGEFVAIASEKYNYHRTEKLGKGEWRPKVGEPPVD